MTAEGYRNRIFAVEWHGRLWQQHGVPFDLCEAMVRHCSEVVECDFYDMPRSQPNWWADPEWLVIMETYFDRLFASSGGLVSYA